jgi:hypothetical protein
VTGYAFYWALMFGSLRPGTAYGPVYDRAWYDHLLRVVNADLAVAARWDALNVRESDNVFVAFQDWTSQPTSQCRLWVWPAPHLPADALPELLREFFQRPDVIDPIPF